MCYLISDHFWLTSLLSGPRRWSARRIWQCSKREGRRSSSRLVQPCNFWSPWGLRELGWVFLGFAGCRSCCSSNFPVLPWFPTWCKAQQNRFAQFRCTWLRPSPTNHARRFRIRGCCHSRSSSSSELGSQGISCLNLSLVTLDDDVVAWSVAGLVDAATIPVELAVFSGNDLSIVLWVEVDGALGGPWGEELGSLIEVDLVLLGEDWWGLGGCKSGKGKDK